MIQASPQMADRLRKLKLRPVVTNAANAIVIDKLHRRIAAYNENHEPAGSPEGGEFAPSEDGTGGDPKDHVSLLPGNTYTNSDKEAVLAVKRSSRALWHSPGFDAVKQALDSVLAKGRTNKDLVVWRGLPLSNHTKEIINNLKPGYTFHFGTFQEATTKQSVAENFAGAWFPAHMGGSTKGCVLKISVPKGTPAIPTTALTRSRVKESGILFGRDTAYKVTKVYTSNNRTYADVDLVRQVQSVSADGSINWKSPSGPVGPDWYDAYIGTSPIPHDHAPSLKNPILTKIPTAQDGWKKGDSKKAKAKAMDDLVEIHKRLRRQTGKPEVSFPALNPVYPTGVTGSAKR